MTERMGGAPPLFATVIGGQSNLIAQECLTRKRIIICNDSNVDLYLAMADEAVWGQGMILKALGGTLIDEPDNAGRIYTGPWSATHNGAFSIFIPYTEVK